MLAVLVCHLAACTAPRCPSAGAQPLRPVPANLAPRLHGDFNGDGLTDEAVLVRNGGDDWTWLGFWRTWRKDEALDLILVGDAIFLEKPESASALAYWNGRDYAWFQLGD